MADQAEEKDKPEKRSMWGQIFDKATGGLFGHKQSPIEKHQSRVKEEDPEHLMDDTPVKGKDNKKTTMNTSVEHPVLSQIMAQLNEQDEDAPMGGKGRYTGMKSV